MIATRQKLFETIRGILTEQVLPELQPKTWMAANIRACAALLTYLEDLVAQDQSALTTTNAAMTALLQALAMRNPAWLGSTLYREINDHPAPGTSIEALESENEALKELLVRAIRRHRDAGGGDEDFIAPLHECLALLSASEMAVAARAATMPPF